MRTELECVVEGAGRLFTLPDICLQLRMLSEDGHSSNDEIARLIGSDPALSARLLKVANSPLYGFQSKIDSIARAITLVGVDEMHNLALATSAASTFAGAGGAQINIRDFWEHSVKTGLMMKIMAETKPSESGEALFLCGLLHNIGKLVALEQLTHFAGAACVTADSRQKPWKREKEVLGYTFADIGAELMKQWGLPVALHDPVAWQNDPLKSSGSKISATLLHIARSWVAEQSEQKQAWIDDEVIPFSGFSMDDLDRMYLDVQERAPEVMKIFV